MTIQGRPITSNIPPVTKLFGDIDDGTTATDMSNITMTPETWISTKAATTYKNISTTKVTRSTTSLKLKRIWYTIKLKL